MSARNRLIACAVVLLALVGAFSAGRFSAPLRVETREVEKVVFKDKIVTVEKVVTVEKAAKVETKIVWRDRVITRDGTVTEHEIEKTGIASNTEKTANAKKNTDAEHAGTTDHTSERVVTVRPNWRVGVLIGASFQQPLLPISGPLVLGATAEYRIVGGLWVGLWTLPQHGSVGASVSFEF